MFCYYKTKADPSKELAKETYRIWRERNLNERPNLTDNALMNQRRYIEKQNKLTEIGIDNIKQRIESELNVQNNQTDSVVDDVFVKEANNPYKETNEIEVSQQIRLRSKEGSFKEIHSHLELAIQVIPVVVGVLGTVKKGMVENMKKVSERATMTEIQKICMLGSAQSSGRCLLYEQND